MTAIGFVLTLFFYICIHVMYEKKTWLGFCMSLGWSIGMIFLVSGIAKWLWIVMP